MTYLNRKFILFLFVLAIIPSGIVFAAGISLKASSDVVGIGEQFYVDVLLDTQDGSYNAVEGSVEFSPDTAFLVRIEDGKSMFNTWIQKPIQESGKISFSGIAPNGFSGVIDPFNPKSKLPGPVLRLVFNGIKPGNLDFSTSKFYITKNDGLGTIEELNPSYLSVKLQNTDNYFVFNNENNSNPQIETEIIKDKNLFDNHYALVFRATDKSSGIKSVMIREGNRPWKEINSPYLLQDQTRHSAISIRATSYSGVTIITKIDAIPYNFRVKYFIIVAVLFVLSMTLIYIRKNRAIFKK